MATAFSVNSIDSVDDDDDDDNGHETQKMTQAILPSNQLTIDWDLFLLRTGTTCRDVGTLLADDMGEKHKGTYIGSGRLGKSKDNKSII